MKKFSKIMTVVLTVVLLCGTMLSVVAQAAPGESREVLNITGASYNKYTDFESTKADGTHYLTPYFVWGNAGSMSSAVVEGSNGNHYARYLGSVDGTGTKECWIVLSDYGDGNLRAGTSIGANDYVTIDFEIGTDKYSYQDGSGVWHTVDTLNDIPADKRPAEDEAYRNLAFYNGTNIGINGRGYKTLGSGSAAEVWNAMPFFIVQDSVSGKWYASGDKTYSANDVELSNKIGEFDHITFVFKTLRNASNISATGYSMKGTAVYVFTNGDFLTSSSINTDNIEAVAPYNLRIMLAQNDRASTCFDNVALNHYGTRAITKDSEGNFAYSNLDPVYVSEGYGIDDYINSGDYTSKPLYSCEDIVYSGNYISPNGYISLDGVPTSVLVDEYLANAKDGSVITTNNIDILDYELPEGVENLTVKILDDSKFTLGSKSAKEFLLIPGTNNTYTVRRATESDFITLNWTYQGTVIKTEKISFNVVPTFSADGIAPALASNLPEAIEWMFDVDGNEYTFGPDYDEEVNLYDAEPVRALTFLEVLLIREELEAKLTVYPAGEAVVVTTNSSVNTPNLSAGSESNQEQYESNVNSNEEQNSVLNSSAPVQNNDVGMPHEINGANANSGTTVSAENTLNLDTNPGASPESNSVKPLVSDVAVESTTSNKSLTWLWYIIPVLMLAIPVALLFKRRTKA